MSTGSIKNRIQQNNSELEDTIDTVEDLPDYLDTSDANATANDILLNKTAYVNGVKITGAYSGGSGPTLNVFVQNTEPTLKKGIWLKKEATPQYYSFEEDLNDEGMWVTNGFTDVPIESYSNSPAVAIGTDVYLLGSEDSDYADVNYKYNTLTDTYTQLTDIPRRFEHGSAVAVGTDIYLFGGGNTSSTRVSAYKYNTLNDTYTQLTNIPTSLNNNSPAVAIGTDIYFMPDGDTQLYKYNTTNDTYTQLSSLPNTIDNFYGRMAAVGTDIYMFSCTNTEPSPYNYKYDTLNDVYTLINSPSYDFDYGSVVAVGTNIYLLGSIDSQTYDGTVDNYKYDTLTNTYTQLTDIPYNYAAGAAVAINTSIYLFGGIGVQETISTVSKFITPNMSVNYQEDDVVVISTIPSYKTELFSSSDFINPIKIDFNDAWYYTIQGGLETDIPTYYGNGTAWVNIKNLPV